MHISPSDHLPILIGLWGWFSVPPADFGPSCYTNYRKADWPSFTAYTEHLFGKLPPPHPPALKERRLSGRYYSRDRNTTSLGEKYPISNPVSQGKSALSYTRETRSVSTTPSILKSPNLTTQSRTKQTQTCYKHGGTQWTHVPYPETPANTGKSSTTSQENALTKTPTNP